jgi:hypothetical protein
MEATQMEYAYLQLHAPEPARPLRDDEARDRNNPYPDYEQSYIVEENQSEDETPRVVVIDIC